ncbi:MAG: hypothetical protein ACXW5U_00740 [Thermoanaerobaculia bacterium]
MHRILQSEHRPLYEQLPAEAHGIDFDYYHCRWHCKRLWRIQQHDRAAGEPYREPEFIGWWDDNARDATPIVYDQPRTIGISARYRSSKTDPFMPARNKGDIRR